jgi:hypothetical protein
MCLLRELLPSLGVRRLLTFHILIFSSETTQPNEVKLGRKHLWQVWRPCLLMNRDEMNNLYREPSKDAPFQVSIHLALWFHRRRFLEINQSETRMACGDHVC